MVGLAKGEGEEAGRGGCGWWQERWWLQVLLCNVHRGLLFEHASSATAGRVRVVGPPQPVGGVN